LAFFYDLYLERLGLVEIGGYRTDRLPAGVRDILTFLTTPEGLACLPRNHLHRASRRNQQIALR
jgi:hypothetical protein